MKRQIEKIKLCDQVIVLSVNGYIGESTIKKLLLLKVIANLLFIVTLILNFIFDIIFFISNLKVLF